MKFTLITEKEDGTILAENYEKDFIKTTGDAGVWAVDTVASFNNGLRPSEQSRELVAVVKGHHASLINSMDLDVDIKRQIRNQIMLFFSQI